MIHLDLWLRPISVRRKFWLYSGTSFDWTSRMMTLKRCIDWEFGNSKSAHSEGSLSVLCQGETWTWLSIAARNCLELELCHLADMNCNVNAILLSRERLLWLKALSRLTYLFVNLPDPPDDLILYKFEALVFRFLSNEKQSRISKMIVCQSCEDGGTGMVDVVSLVIYKDWLVEETDLWRFWSRWYRF